MLIAAALAVTAWQAAPAQSNELQLRMQMPWTNWLNEDAAYIATDAERKAFSELRTDDERKKFVEQFWLRRGGSAFKEEHYRRIAYANAHFESSVPGWKTDLGRIYIMYGPPDVIYAQPPGGRASASPYIGWRYRHIDGIGNDISIEFIDANNTGEYHMTMDPSGKNALIAAPRK